MGEEQRGGPERRPGGYQLPAVNWALAAEESAAESVEPADESAAATAVLPAPRSEERLRVEVEAERRGESERFP
ncbi:hypothetical protein AB0E96_38640, partial [Kitasatospora sp. NPDC036755]|uniref:hypothetical protein n=1 Tax=Kitasatospora sp. NPDC036755 TaxID=3154600 RepID=UPI0033D098DD